MAGLRLSPSASVTRTDVGVILHSDLGSFKLDGPDLGQFMDRVFPLLDGTRDGAAVAAEVTEFSKKSVLALLDVLKSHQLVVEAGESDPTALDGQRTFFDQW